MGSSTRHGVVCLVFPALRWRQEGLEFKITLSYLLGLRSAWTTWDPIFSVCTHTHTHVREQQTVELLLCCWGWCHKPELRWSCCFCLLNPETTAQAPVPRSPGGDEVRIIVISLHYYLMQSWIRTAVSFLRLREHFPVWDEILDPLKLEKLNFYIT